jgi:DNA-binding transcriptional regulator GbsR (MarR family)
MTRLIAVDSEEFVRAWQTSESVSEVSDRLGLSKLSASVKASHLRSAGVPLKKFRTGTGSDPAEFIAVWNEASTLDEAAERLGVQKTSASMRASHLRKGGYAVKRFPRGRRSRDLTPLAEIARQYT